MRFPVITLALAVAMSSGAHAQSTRPATAAAATQAAPTFKTEQIEQIVAPIALYPDSLLAQVLMSSTYPLEVVQAQRWSDANKQLKGDALAKELEKQTWDPSVRSLVNFPDVLRMMSEKLDWTIKLGDAFLAQQKDVMDAVQKLRGKAQATGNLKTNEQQKVSVNNTASGQTIVIQQASPEVVYVPAYNPTVVYGTWPYPAYPPAYYYPPYYTPGPAVSFGVGLAVGVAWGYAWGNCNWDNDDIDIDIDQNVDINHNINREKYKNEINNAKANRADGTGNRVNSTDRKSSWQHNPTHRQGAPYRDAASAQKFGRPSTPTAGTSGLRDSYRGYSPGQGTSGAARPSVGNTGIGTGTPRPTGGYTGDRVGASPGGNTRAPSTFDRTTPSGTRYEQTGSRGSGFSGVNQGSSSTRNYSSRGTSSRAAPSRAAPSRGGGGGRRR